MATISDPTATTARDIDQTLWNELREDERFFDDIPDTLIVFASAIRVSRYQKSLERPTNFPKRRNKWRKLFTVGRSCLSSSPAALVTAITPSTGDYRLHAGLDLEAGAQQDVLAACRSRSLRRAPRRLRQRIEVLHKDQTVTRITTSTRLRCMLANA